MIILKSIQAIILNKNLIYIMISDGNDTDTYTDISHISVSAFKRTDISVAVFLADIKPISLNFKKYILPITFFEKK